MTTKSRGCRQQSSLWFCAIMSRKYTNNKLFLTSVIYTGFVPYLDLCLCYKAFTVWLHFDINQREFKCFVLVNPKIIFCCLLTWNVESHFSIAVHWKLHCLSGKCSTSKDRSVVRGSSFKLENGLGSTAHLQFLWKKIEIFNNRIFLFL